MFVIISYLPELDQPDTLFTNLVEIKKKLPAILIQVIYYVIIIVIVALYNN